MYILRSFEEQVDIADNAAGLYFQAVYKIEVKTMQMFM